jgi:Protein of unknown function (DUF3644)
MTKKNRAQNKLEDWEVGIVKAMITAGFDVDQDIVAYFTRPNRSINQSRIGDIRHVRKHSDAKSATAAELKKFLADWPHIDPQTGLNVKADELIIKSREAMLVAVQSYNNPRTYFRSEVFIVTAVIAWTYLLHAFYKKKGVDYRHKKTAEDGIESILKTKHGADKHWELDACLGEPLCPLSEGTKRNLEFLILIRHEIEHQMTTRIDSSISAKLQACCMNYNRSLKELFGDELGLDAELSFALQFSSLNPKLTEELIKDRTLPAHIEAARASMEDALSEEDYNDAHYSFRVLYIRRQASKKSHADEVVQFVAATGEQQEAINDVLVKETERKKFRAGQVVSKMQQLGFGKFKQHHHTELWKALDGKNPSKGHGVETESDGWRWYQRWIDAVHQHCEENKEKYQ